MKITNIEIIGKAVNLFGIDINSLRFLGGDDGDVYEARQDNQAVILKMVPTTDQGLITLSEKIDFAHFLSANGIRLARWLPSVDNRLIEVIKVDEILVAATALEKVPGRHPNMRDAAAWNAALFCQWGQVMGRMHQLAQQYTGGDAIGHWHHEVAFFVDWCSDPEVKARWRDMEAYLKTLPRPQNAYGLIHNDLHQWNFMLNEGRIIIFDFDVCGHHWFSTDIAIALFHGLWVDSWRGTPATRERTQKLYGSFMEGYAQENVLDEEWLGRLPYFLKYRQLLSFTVFSDPASAAHASRWQQRWVAKMRHGIVEDIPVLDLNF